MTTLTTAQQVRLRIQDVPAIVDTTLYGDGTADTFSLAQRNQSSGSAFVPNGAAWAFTGSTFDPTFGSVQFANIVSAGSAFRLRYVYSIFSDDDIGTMITAGGDVVGASIEAVQTLMFDSLKRAVWKAPDGSMYDDTAAQRALKDLYDTLKQQQADIAVGQGGISEWGLNQTNY